MHTDGKYILKDGKVVEEYDLLVWGQWYETADRKIEKTTRGIITVSTIFLGMSLPREADPPLLCQTTVFGGKSDGLMDYYATMGDAKTGHVALVAKVWPDGTPKTPE